MVAQGLGEDSRRARERCKVGNIALFDLGSRSRNLRPVEGLSTDLRSRIRNLAFSALALSYLSPFHPVQTGQLPCFKLGQRLDGTAKFSCQPGEFLNIIHNLLGDWPGNSGGKDASGYGWMFPVSAVRMGEKVQAPLLLPLDRAWAHKGAFSLIQPAQDGDDTRISAVSRCDSPESSRLGPEESTIPQRRGERSRL